MLPWRRNAHSKRSSSDGDQKGAPLDLPLDEFMYYVMVCEVRCDLGVPFKPCPANAIESLQLYCAAVCNMH